MGAKIEFVIEFAIESVIEFAIEFSTINNYCLKDWLIVNKNVVEDQLCPTNCDINCSKVQIIDSECFLYLSGNSFACRIINLKQTRSGLKR